MKIQFLLSVATVICTLNIAKANEQLLNRNMKDVSKTLESEVWSIPSMQILKNADGTVALMKREQAMKACPAGTHVPTARELGNLMELLGVGEVLKSPPVGRTTFIWDVPALNPDGKNDVFFYNYENYTRSALSKILGLEYGPDDVEPLSGVWTSSRNIKAPTYDFISFSALSGAFGGSAYRGGLDAEDGVLCVQDN